MPQHSTAVRPTCVPDFPLIQSGMPLASLDGFLNSGWTMVTAGAGIVFTQLIIYRRERIRLLTEKLELIHQQVFAGLDLCNRMADLYSQRKVKELLDHFSASGLAITSRLDFLSKLHFPQLHNDAREVSEAFARMMYAAIPAENVKVFSAAYKKTSDLLKAMEGRMLNETDVLITRNWPLLQHWWERQCSGERS